MKEIMVMYMKSRKKIVLIIIVCIWLFMFSTDFICTKLEKKPLFSFKFASYMDGGSKQYLGLGYQVIHFNSIVSDERDSFTIPYYYIGPICPIDSVWKKVKHKAIEKYFIDNNLDYDFNYDS